MPNIITLDELRKTRIKLIQWYNGYQLDLHGEVPQFQDLSFADFLFGLDFVQSLKQREFPIKLEELDTLPNFKANPIKENVIDYLRRLLENRLTEEENPFPLEGLRLERISQTHKNLVIADAAAYHGLFIPDNYGILLIGDSTEFYKKVDEFLQNNPFFKQTYQEEGKYFLNNERIFNRG